MARVTEGNLPRVLAALPYSFPVNWWFFKVKSWESHHEALTHVWIVRRC